MTASILSAALAAQLFAGTDGPFLRKLAEVESGMNTRAVGKLGERGIYQFRAVTWKMTTGLSFAEAFDPQIATAMARHHLEYLASKFKSLTNRSPTGPELYTCWNLGLAGFHRRGFELKRCPKSTQRNAAKFESIKMQ